MVPIRVLSCAETESFVAESFFEEFEKQKSMYEKQLEAQKLELDRAIEEMTHQFEHAQEVMSQEHAQSLARLEVRLDDKILLNS